MAMKRAQVTKKPAKRVVKRRATRKKMNHRANARIYGATAMIGLMLCFSFALFGFGWIGEHLRQVSEVLFGEWGAFTYVLFAAPILIGLLFTQVKEQVAYGLIFVGSVLVLDLWMGEPRGYINAFLFRQGAYLLSVWGIFFLALVLIVIGVSLQAPHVWGHLWKQGKRALEYGYRVLKERTRTLVPSQQPTRKTEKRSPVVESAPAREEDMLALNEIPIIGFADTVSNPYVDERSGGEQVETETVAPLLLRDHEQSGTYEKPSLTLLTEPVQTDLSGENARLKENASILVRTLKSFGVGVKVLKIHLGPTVTKYELQPDIGVKVSKITSLSDDLALALAAKGIRIEAPIPGKAAIGIEVPNREVAPVCLREVLEADTVRQDESVLLAALGRSVSGETVTIELNKMPHLLVAGSTGSGKSVCINGIISSLLIRSRPDEVRLLMIDPKMVELNVYNGIPHLLAPVVTDPKQAAQALKQVVSEMERRYELFSRFGVRNIEGYNELVEQSTDEDAKRLPFIVVIVDELADLMMVASSEVEDAIMRLAQMARAAGIHMVIATQRPSVDVITGVIKANIPSRIAFAVSSQTDSRTILDSGGAEKLLGRGDMLMLANGMNKPLRVQGAFVSDQEVERIVAYVISQQKAQYVETMIPKMEDVTDVTSQDALFTEVVDFVIEQDSVSTSMIQRRFRIGYNRAARLIDELEQNGYVGPSEGSKPRRVLRSTSDY